MKPAIRILCMLAFMLPGMKEAFCQQYDRHWLGRIVEQHKGVFMSFGVDSISYQIAPPNGSVIGIEDGCLAMSDAEGELQFYTNGNVIASWDHNIMDGGKGFNQGATYDDFLSKWGSGAPDTTWNTNYNPYTYQIIPDAYNESIYYMIHAFVIETGDSIQIYVPKMQISKIDMAANGGKGKVVYKNHYFDEELVGAGFALVRHGNGRDWWVVLRKLDGLAYRSVLLQGDSVVESVNSIMPGLSSDWFSFEDWRTTTSNLLDASMDGSRLLDIYGKGKVKLLSFDRCNGEVSLIDTFSTGITPLEISNGDTWNVANYVYQFSPSGRYLYGAGYAEFAQWDLEAPDIAASKVKLGGPPWALDEEQNVLEGTRGGFKAFAFGPDGKIYNLFQTAHSVIEYPDEKGAACGLCLAADNPPSCLGVPYYLFSNRHPNYRLGALEGSACDTILSDVRQPTDPGAGYAIQVSPSPATGPVQVEVVLPDYASPAELRVYDTQGRLIQLHSFPPYAYLHTFDVQNWPPGVYNLVLVDKGLLRASARLMVVR